MTYASKFTTFIYFSLFFEAGNLEMSGKNSIFAADLGEVFILLRLVLPLSSRFRHMNVAVITR